MTKSGFVAVATFKLYFLIRYFSISTAIDEKKEEQKSTYQIFLKDVTKERNFRKKNHKHC